MESKLNKNQKLIIFFSACILIVIAIGISYAYFSAGITDSESTSTIVVGGGTLSIIYDDSDPAISISNAYPSDEAWAEKTFTITGTNTTDLKMNYQVNLVVDNNTFTEDSLTYTLVGIGTGTVINSEGNVPANGYVELGKGQFLTGTNINHSYILKIYFEDTGINQNEDQGATFAGHIGVLDAGTGDNVPAWWLNAQSGTLISAIKTNYPNPTEPLTTPWKHASLGTFSDNSSYMTYPNSSSMWTYGSGYTVNQDGTFNLTGIQNGEYSDIYESLEGKYITDPFTFSGDISFSTTNASAIYRIDSASSSSLYMTPQIGTQTERELSETLDDYGISYYYRGAVENNYVVFADMCWRIVRITGDGSIKLALFNNNNGNYDNPCSSSYDDGLAAFAGTSKFNNSASSNAYIGFMYGTPNSSSYAQEHANINKSSILLFLEDWYDEKLADYSDYLADVIWCNDKSVVDANVYANALLSYADFYESASTITNLGYGDNNPTIYGIGNHILDPDYSNNNLICPNDSLGGNLSKFTVSDSVNGNGDLDYPIGLLTTDELVYSGVGIALINSKSYESSTSHYLFKNTESSFMYFTLTPYEYLYTDGVYISFINEQVFLNTIIDYMADSSSSVRPSIALKSSTVVTGTGTQEDPYIVVSY